MSDYLSDTILSFTACLKTIKTLSDYYQDTIMLLSGYYHVIIKVLSGYYQDTIKLSGCNVIFMKLANTKKQKQPNQTHTNFAEELLL